MIILKWILKKYKGVDWIYVTQAQLVGCCEHSNEPFSSARGRELLH